MVIFVYHLFLINLMFLTVYFTLGKLNNIDIFNTVELELESLVLYVPSKRFCYRTKHI